MEPNRKERKAAPMIMARTLASLVSTKAFKGPKSVKTEAKMETIINQNLVRWSVLVSWCGVVGGSMASSSSVRKELKVKMVAASDRVSTTSAG